jgi:hypothetical protein
LIACQYPAMIEGFCKIIATKGKYLKYFILKNNQLLAFLYDFCDANKKHINKIDIINVVN